MAKTPKKDTAPQQIQETADTSPREEAQKPIIHLLALTGTTGQGHVPMHLVLRGSELVGYKPGTDRPQEWSIALDVLKILSTRLFLNRNAFKSDALPADLVTDDLSPVADARAIGVLKAPDGKYLPIAVKIESGKVTSTVPLFSSSLALNEACSVYRGRFTKFFVQRQLIVE